MSHRMISIPLHGIRAARAHAYLDGEDVSRRCFAADPLEGWVDCYVTNSQGDLEVDHHREPKTERLYGQVRIEAIE